MSKIEIKNSQFLVDTGGDQNVGLNTASFYINKNVNLDTGYCNSNPNLLDNWYWSNPISQRESNVNPRFDGDFPIDRWRVTQPSNSYYTRAYLNTNSDGVKYFFLAAGTKSEGPLYFRQKLSCNTAQLIGKTITASLLSDDGRLIYSTFQYGTDDNLHDLIFIKDRSFSPGTAMPSVKVAITKTNPEYFILYVNPGFTHSSVAIKLELGAHQTLAHLEGENTWVLNEIPDYGEELRKCQRYYYKPDRRGYNLANFNKHNEELGLHLFYPVEMADVPSVSYTSYSGTGIRISSKKTDCLIQTYGDATNGGYWSEINGLEFKISDFGG